MDTEFPFGPPQDVAAAPPPRKPQGARSERPNRPDQPDTPARRDDKPSEAEGVLVVHLSVLTKRGLALAPGQGVRAWKHGSIWGAAFEPITVWAFTAPVFMRDTERGPEPAFLMGPECPEPHISMKELREGTLEPAAAEVARRYPMDGRGLQIRVTSCDRTGILPLLKPGGVGSARAGFHEEPLTPAAFVSRVTDDVTFEEPLTLPGYYRVAPDGALWMWDVLQGKTLRVSPVSVPFALRPGEDFLSPEILQVVRGAEWESRLGKKVMGGFFDMDIVRDVYFGYALAEPDEIETHAYSPQEQASRLRGSRLQLLPRQSLEPLAGDARRILAGILGASAPWEFEPSRQTGF